MKVTTGAEKAKAIHIYLLILVFIGQLNNAISQDLIVSEQVDKISNLFKNEEILPMKLSFSNKVIRDQTNDSTYISTALSYEEKEGTWKTMEVAIRRRGNFRRKNCYFPPLKIKIDKATAAGTLFEGNKKLKLVLPCFRCKDMNDKLIKEYMAYKLYEIVSPYHFKTRLVNIEFTEIRAEKIKKHQLLGIFIEDIKKVANRHDGRILKRHMRALAHEARTSVRNNLFNFMIGNTDYSTTYQHNQKILFIDKKMMSIPYDFDMSGLVNADYAIVSNVQNLKLNISKVTERMYKGYKRDPAIFKEVRREFLENQRQMMEMIETYKGLFINGNEYDRAKKFLLGFFKIMENDQRFQANILAMLRE